MASRPTQVVGLVDVALIAWAGHKTYVDTVAGAHVERRYNAVGVLIIEVERDSAGRIHSWDRAFNDDGVLINEALFYHEIIEYQALYWPTGVLQKRIVKGFWTDSVEEFDENGNLVQSSNR